jgi:hypothetical protein
VSCLFLYPNAVIITCDRLILGFFTYTTSNKVRWLWRILMEVLFCCCLTLYVVTVMVVMWNEFSLPNFISGGTRWLQAEGSGFGSRWGSFGIFHWHNRFGRTMALRSTQPLTEMSTRSIVWVKGGQCVGLRTLPSSCTDCLKILGVLTSWSPKGLTRPV